NCIMPVFDFSFEVDAPLVVVQEFHHGTSALKQLTPPPTIVQIQSVEPLAEGSISRFTLWVGPLPLRWTAIHKNVSDNGFTDVQQSGPAKKWEHTHTFTEVDATHTRINEHIEYEHKRGLWGIVTRILFSYPNLYFMFCYRRWITKRTCYRIAQKTPKTHAQSH
ncbi:MAG: hypothetical protein MUQ52_10465, partial [Pirellulales bacterium]|nr:hypothetical protein [Pirellulales bacterium]